VIPSNTLATLQALTLEAVRSGRLGGLEVETVLVDDTVQSIPWRRLGRDARRPETRVVVALCGVQTNQVPRAWDLARRFRERGLEVLIGGFHVSGANAVLGGVAPELRELMDLGVHLFRGEADACWEEILRGAAEGTLPPMIDRMDSRPDLRGRPIPVAEPAYLRRFALPDTGTLDAGRGCPFDCSFCTVVQVQGRAMRCRAPVDLLAALRRQYLQGTRFYFFTDDNFARHREWEEIFDGLAGLRREGLDLTFVMQVDTLAARIPRFADKAAAAGCLQVFIGLESLNPENLAAGGKRQNQAADFREMIAAWHARGIVTNCGYILGFPADTPASLAEDVRRLREEIGPALASFFILTPLPGSRDHARAVEDGLRLDGDLNRYDSFHPVAPHPRMSGEDLARAYRQAWRDFYTPSHMKRCLRRFRGAAYGNLFHSYVWYRNAMELGEHPMMSGFLRLRDRRERRASFPREGRMAHAWRQGRELVRQLRAWTRLIPEMRDVWKDTRRPGEGMGGLSAVLKAAFAASGTAWKNLLPRTFFSV